jgi:hypothetical protein
LIDSSRWESQVKDHLRVREKQGRIWYVKI